MHDFSEDEFLRDIWVNPSNLSLPKNEDLEKKVNLAFFSVYVSLRSLAMVSVNKINSFIDSYVLLGGHGLFEQKWDISFVDHVQPKYFLPLESYLTDEDMVQLQKIIKKKYPKFPRMGNLLVSESLLRPFRDDVDVWFSEIEGKIEYEGNPYGFANVSLLEYKEYLLDIFGPRKFAYANFSSKFLEDYSTIESLLNLENVLRLGDYVVVDGVDDAYTRGRTLYKNYVLGSLFWKGISNIKGVAKFSL